MHNDTSKQTMGFFNSLVLSLVLVLFFSIPKFGYGGITSAFVRKDDISKDMPIDSDLFKVPQGPNAPQQVHITQGNRDGDAMIISWVTPKFNRSNKVVYWSEKLPMHKKHSHGVVTTYKYYNYTSGFIHHCTLKHLEFDTKYYYSIRAGHVKRTFSFTTPPKVGPDVPYTFGIIGDLGQTHDSNRTLTHYMMNPKKGQTVLYAGDLSYADRYQPYHDNVRWDTWGRFVEQSTAYQPWIWAAGNHEIDHDPEIGETSPFKPYTHRYYVPYKESQSTSPLWYSIRRASAHIIVLSSYSAFSKYTPQYLWLEKELEKVNRTETPWLIVIVHCPIYNSYEHHETEGEAMRVVFETWFVVYKVDLVISGHVHAYERSERISNYRINDDAPVYITIGDGGNSEGLSTKMKEPQPLYSAYREASFGHAILDIKNQTHAHFTWHRNDDGYAVEADSTWFHNNREVDESRNG